MADAFGVAGAGADLASILRAQAGALLLAANTLAGKQVETARDAAFTSDDAQTISIYTTDIERTWLGDSPPSFLAKIKLVVVGRVLARGARLPGQPSLVETQTDTLRVQIENAILASAAFYRPYTPMERINSVTSTIDFRGDNELHEGTVMMTVECQCTDVFAPILGVPLETVGLVVPNATIPANEYSETAPLDNLIGATITIPQGD